MKHKRSLLAVTVATALVVTGCVRAVVTTHPDKQGPAYASAFCQQAIVYRQATNDLNGALVTADPTRTRQLVQTAQEQAQALAATTGDPLQKADLATISAGYDRLGKALDALKTPDPTARVQALTALSQDKAVTLAATRLDTYFSTFCGLNPYGVPPSSIGTIPPATTIVGPTGPAVSPSSTAPPTTR